MYDALLAHEMGHVAVIKTYEKELKKALAEMAPATSKAMLEAEIEKAEVRAAAAVKAANDEYEAKTTDAEGHVIGVEFNGFCVDTTGFVDIVPKFPNIFD
jgi:predicted secreted Zn-dependent protease